LGVLVSGFRLRKQRKQKRAAASNGFDDESIQFGWLADSIAFRLRRAQEASSQALVRPAGDDDLKLGSFALLKLIRENPGINQTALSRANGKDKSTLTSSLRNLEKRGFISRRRERVDKRNYTLSLTAGGVEEMELLQSFAQMHEQKLRKIVGASKVQEFLETLERVAFILES
jgi:DNA-binding MarR family transcriptional regulator